MINLKKTKRVRRLLKKDKKELAPTKKVYKVRGMKKIPFTSVVWREKKYYVAQCLNVDVSSFGKTKALALKNLKEALLLYLEGESQSKIRGIEAPSLEVQHV
jgi:predicted RNase H-like HicB family nuclease